MNVASALYFRVSNPVVFRSQAVGVRGVLGGGRLEFGSEGRSGSDRRRLLPLPERAVRTPEDTAREIAEAQDGERWDGLA